MGKFTGNFKSLLKSRKFKYGSVATGLTIAFIAFVVVINMIFSLLADRFSWKLDVTSYDLYSISKTTKQTVQSLTKDYKITLNIMYSEEEYPEQIKEPIKRIANLSENIEYTFIDLDVNPQAADKFGKEYKIDPLSIVVQRGDRIRVITPEDLAEQDAQTGAMTYKTEECLTAAIKYVTKDEAPLVYFITGHGEAGYEELMSLFANNGADVAEVRLDQLEEFDPLAQCMVISGPAGDYTENEIRQVQEFLANKYNYERNLFYFENPANAALPNLDAFLATWGIRVEDNIVLESDAYSTSASPLYTMPTLTTEQVAGETLKVKDYATCIIPNSASVTLLFENKEITETAALLTTSDASYAKSAEKLNEGYAQEAGDAEGPFHLAVLSTRYKYNQENIPVYSHVFAAGSVDMLHESFMTENFNSPFIYEVYQMMMGVDEEEITGKEVASSYMTLDAATVRWTSIFFVGIIPGLCLVIGLIVFIRRRYL